MTKEMLYKNRYISPLGDITILADDEYIRGVWFENQKYYGSEYDLDTIPTTENGAIRQVRKWLNAYFSGQAPTINPIILKPDVSPFRRQVLNILAEIPYGQTITYKEIASKLEVKNGRRTSARAVGGAVGHNPISILIPCHRVVGSDGALTGYAGGIERKVGLLSLEGIEIDSLS